MNPFIGKKVILDNLHPSEIGHFVKLHMEDKNGYLQRFCLKKMSEDEAKHYVSLCILSREIVPYTVVTKEGKASRVAGFVYLTGLTERSCEVNGIMDKEFAKGLGKVLRKDKYTFAEDTLRTMVNHVFQIVPTMNRVVLEALEINKPALKLAEKQDSPVRVF